MRSLIVDDEESARARLCRMLDAHPEIQVVGEARDGLDAVRQVEELTPALLFLDIEMPGLTGFEVLRAIPPTVTLPLVIFITGYDEHALAAFEANALAYLLKPVEPERLAQAVSRAHTLHSVSGGESSERERILKVARESQPMLRQIVGRKRDRAVLLPPDQIHWFRMEDGVVKARAAADTFWVNHTLSELEGSLPQEMFFRARREVLVNLQRIKEIRPYFKSGFLLIMADADATEIAVSERQAKSLRQRIPGL